MNNKERLASKRLRFGILNLFSWVPDEPWLKLLFRIKNGYWMDMKHPVTFNEKLQWLKIHDRKPEYTQMVDKEAVKAFVAERIGREYVIPTLGVWDRPEDIEWDKLPRQFVLKTTHGGGSSGVVICKDKDSLNKEDAVRKLKDSYSISASAFREHPYDGVKKRVIAEQLISTRDPKMKDLPDYKFYCFDGEPKYCQVIRDRSTNETIDFYDMEWQHQEFVGLNPVARPGNLDDMKRICRELSKDKPFVRVDLYEVDGKEYFGELTFYPAGGYKEWNKKLGEMISLPSLWGGICRIILSENQVFVNVVNDDLRDYKFFCFNGICRCFKIDFGRFTEHHANYYTPQGKILPFGESKLPPIYEHKEIIPNNLDEMLKLAEKLSKDIPFLRVDLYNINGKILFGETTFYPASGLEPFTDMEWDKKLGGWVRLPNYMK